MSTTLTALTTAHAAHYAFFEHLLTTSFPPEEYRDLAELRHITDTRPLFHPHLVLEDEKPIGLITYWDFGRFCYVEHFAIDPVHRNGGRGAQVMQLFFSQIQKPVVLEVEPPTEEMARRRIGFYERQGLELWQTDYLQPPYRKGDDYLPLKLMVKGNLSETEDFEEVKTLIHKEVYGV